MSGCEPTERPTPGGGASDTVRRCRAPSGNGHAPDSVRKDPTSRSSRATDAPWLYRFATRGRGTHNVRKRKVVVVHRHKHKGVKRVEVVHRHQSAASPHHDDTGVVAPPPGRSIGMVLGVLMLTVALAFAIVLIMIVGFAVIGAGVGYYAAGQARAIGSVACSSAGASAWWWALPSSSRGPTRPKSSPAPLLQPRRRSKSSAPPVSRRPRPCRSRQPVLLGGCLPCRSESAVRTGHDPIAHPSGHLLHFPRRQWSGPQPGSRLRDGGCVTRTWHPVRPSLPTRRSTSASCDSLSNARDAPQLCEGLRCVRRRAGRPAAERLRRSCSLIDPDPCLGPRRGRPTSMPGSGPHE